MKLEAALDTEIDNEEPIAYEKMALGALADLKRPVAS